MPPSTMSPWLAVRHEQWELLAVGPLEAVILHLHTFMD